MQIRARFVVSLFALASFVSACGDSKSPTAPSQPSNTPRGNLAISDVAATVQGSPGDLTYTLSFKFKETGGAGVTLNTISLSLDGRSASEPLNNVRLPANGESAISKTTFADRSGAPAASQITVGMTFTDDGGRTGSAQASANVTALRLVTLSGIIRDSGTQRPLANATVRVQSGPNEGLSSRTDGNGFYSLAPLVAGEFRIFVEASGYVGQSHPINIGSDARYDVSLSQAPADVEYTITGTARTCAATYASSGGGTSQARVNIPWSFRRTARSGDFLYVSCQIDHGGSSESITVRIYRRGSLVDSATAVGFANIATASGSY